MKRALLSLAATAAFTFAGAVYAASAPAPAGGASPAAPATGATPTPATAPATPAAPEPPSAPTTPPTAPTSNGDPSAPATPPAGPDAAPTGTASPTAATTPAPTGVGLSVGAQIVDNTGAMVGPVTAISNGADGKPVATVQLDDKTFAVPISSLLVQDGKGTINLTRAQIQAMVARASAAPEPAAQ